jgi:hypothetical protein
VTDLFGHEPDDATAESLDSVESKPWWKHTFKIDPSASLPSFVLETGFTDLASAAYQRLVGCKVNSMGIDMGGDGELTASVNVLGVSGSLETTAYDASVTAIEPFNERWNQLDSGASEGGSTVEVVSTVGFQFNNNLDPDSFVIGGQGKRRAAPAGIAGVGGTISALFEDTTILTKAVNQTESSMKVMYVNSMETIAFQFDEVMYQDNGPAVGGPEGVMLDLEFQAFYGDGSNESALVVEIVNQQGAYA